MSIKLSQLRADFPTSSLDGTEIIEVTQGGVSKGALISQIPNIGNSNLTLTGNRIVDLDGKSLSIQQGGNDVLKINPDGSVLNYLPLNAQVDSYTLAATDINNLITITKGTPVDLTLPRDSDAIIGIGASGLVCQGGAGQITFVAGAGATLLSAAGKVSFTAQNAIATWIKVAANTYRISGDLEA